MNVDLSALNEEQLAAVLDTDGAVMVTAGAGSGKTRLLTHRIAHLILDKNVPPYRILAITFTNKAANEMKERLERMVPEAENIWIFTFHALCVRILRKFISKLGYTSNFSIYAEDEKERTIKKLCKSAGDFIADDLPKRIQWAVSDAKNDGLDPDGYFASHKGENDIEFICKIYGEYEYELRRNNALDFDDLLTKTYSLLKGDEEARAYYQDKFQYIHVDEFQDTNTIQYDLIKILGAKFRNVFVVGDEDQCIYGWRGANIRNIYSFMRDFDCRTYKLERNYRSTGQILELANKLIANNGSRIPKRLWTQNDSGVPVELIVAQNESNEADMVVSRIVRLVRTEGYKYSDMAILMRLNALTRSFEERLVQYGIPHKIFGGFKFFERKEIKDLLAYLKILANPLDSEAIVRVVNFPKRGIGESSVSQLIRYAEVNGASLNDVIVGMKENRDLPLPLVKKILPFSELIVDLLAQKDVLSLPGLVQYLVDRLRLRTLYADDTEENENRRLHIDEFINSVKQYAQDNPGMTLEDYMQMITLYSDLDEMDETNDCVNLATVHSAKGLEFKVVFVVGMEENIFPIRRASDTLADMEEERRLMYVAVTRARERLYLSRAESRFLYGSRSPTLPSCFLKELGLDCRPVYRQRPARSALVSAPPIRPTVVPTAQKNESVDLSGFKVGGRVRHRKFGEGVVLSIANEHNGCYAEIEFNGIGRITLALAYAPLTVIE